MVKVEEGRRADVLYPRYARLRNGRQKIDTVHQDGIWTVQFNGCLDATVGCFERLESYFGK